MTAITKTDLRIDHHLYGLDAIGHNVDIRVDTPAGEPGKYSYLVEVEKIENGLHVHWKKVPCSIDQDPLSNMTATANKTARWVLGLGLLFIAIGTTSLFIKFPEKKRSGGQIVRIAPAAFYLLAGLAMVIYARNRWVA